MRVPIFVADDRGVCHLMGNLKLINIRDFSHQSVTNRKILLGNLMRIEMEAMGPSDRGENEQTSGFAGAS